MYDRMQSLDQQQLTLIHDAAIDILKNTGLVFHDEQAVAIFKENGFKVENKTVFFTEQTILKALEQAPSRFLLRARNPKYDIEIGGDGFVFMPTGGAPFVADKEGRHCPASMETFVTCCKLIQTSDVLAIASPLVVQPAELPEDKAHLDLLLAMNFEKWLIDEELCRLVKKNLLPIKITEQTIDVKTIKRVGIGGHYLDHPTTHKHFAALSQPVLFNRKNYSAWNKAGGLRIDEVAEQHISQRLRYYQKPAIDPEVEEALNRFVAQSKEAQSGEQ